MKELTIIEQTIANLKTKNQVLLQENIELKKQLEKQKKANLKEKNYITKYRTLYMKYKHQQNNFEKITFQYKEVIRLLQTEIVKSCKNKELFEKIEKLNELSI